MPGAWEDSGAVLQDSEELQVLYKTIDSFYQYRRQSHFNITHTRRQNFYALPPEHQRMLAQEPFNFQDRFDAIDDAIDANAKIADHILMHALRSFGFDGQDGIHGNEIWQSTCEPNDLIKASTIINQFYRDWSAEGAVERDVHYAPVLRDLDRVFADVADKSNLKILVPGAGLGRLVFDICMAGYNVEGNEISYHALLASAWVMNSLSAGDKFALFPFASRFSNQLEFAQQLKAVEIPDVHVSTEIRQAAESQPAGQSGGTISMSASDFLTAYKQPEHKDLYDAVVTVFFIDTAPNLLRYIETISHTLKPGGYWINLGPLLWHFEDKTPPSANEEGQPVVNGASHSTPAGIEEAGSVELTLHDVMRIIVRMGFQVTSMETRSENQAGYIQQPISMLQSLYRVAQFVARKL
ncbi:MAG: hypothetical protein GOMPHAMPRED_004792 [Gomphillus americanus]|uniref:carnosine N-methyltransferase n=1 Tax=Gomphillus americanus TaxID=1940652 RepID=A0A8H3EPG6_9LECA|nr:MAG: hypothetical protein GOMPHAMPRED_004792 [Gomphillus americanus]